MKITFQKAKKLKQKPDPNTLKFGKLFTDHMFIMDYNVDKGWYNGRIVPFGNLSLHPSSTVLHYGSEIFEGLKAYRTKNGDVQLFRVNENAKRLNVSAERMCLPAIPEDMVKDAVMEFVKVEKDWVPDKEGTSLYIRPYMFGNDETLGVHAVENAMFVIIASPVGTYYKEGIMPTKIMVESTDVRAVKGGTGAVKCGGNYAASTRAGKLAEDKGYSQVLWLDGVERKYIEEVGAMNVMFKINGKVVTPMLQGSILPGITRKSCIEVLESNNMSVDERLISIDEVITAIEDGTLTEAWGCGTAAVVSPIGELCYKDKKYTINNGKIGDITQLLYDTITGVQWGKLEDKYNWIFKIK